MLLTLTTTHRPATDLGYLLVKHPGKVHSFDVPTGTAHVLYPEAEEDRCTAALLLDIDPQRLRAQRDAFELSQYVNDRPYAASSLLASALARVFRSALRGASRDRPELAATSIPLEIHVPVLRGTPELVSRLFTPLGWQVTATPIPFEAELGGDSRYVDVHLSGELRVADALNHLYVLLPVLDDGKHYWVAPDEIEKLLRSGEGWLAAHPEKVLIARRYLAHRRSLATTALQLLEADQPATEEEAELPVTRRAPLAEQRREAVLAALTEVGASRVLDLGCGGGALLTALVKDRGLTEIVGADVSTRSLEQAARRLRLDRLPERQKDRIRLIQTALTYRDDRLRGFDAAVLMEVIEHIDLPRLPALEAAVFGHARPGAVIVTTPNVEYNVHYDGLTGMRHSDHRFEWTRAEFAAWAESVAAAHGYTVTIRGVGEADEVTGAPTQLALFKISEVTA
ncbi:3' terminal RNA ribose 2'-O-methyltransferase Hen1 [Actinoplanes campanulatus]|uniref:Small RNA 2'-O-methyltransferase n=1 Tax=Actinoplanes campanulatus TaxID=113559 RepID=A0A7W5ANU8_9ACTN|nr:3' terminal RNA ribose 2'-O-methyltransferase Hen1 [Actinoplanes campanulatus]MBB3099658.1 3' terminal RNA ribose 2'-O-methyltransferase Hen1 [Actinoplanes campanulatus]GGN25916.1 3' terminal RNA ribose 2'-O-methyltransferase Hen1 [Actinoplanes campanulatus]GID41551.1 3' terminal RNA ribose 2'-O-methyltransferase Hen1 [Actinoplanes campanulatus]